LQTNLALKGIIGIHAMSELAMIVGNDADAKYFKASPSDPRHYFDIDTDS